MSLETGKTRVGMSFEIGKNLETQEPFKLDIASVITGRTVIASITRWGKSWTTRKIVESCFGHAGIIIIDPEGEFASLREKFPFLIIGKDIPLQIETAEFMADKTVESTISVIIDLSLIDEEQGKEYVNKFLRRFQFLETTAKKPYLVVVEEGEDFGPEKGIATQTCLGILNNLTKKGGKRGVGIIHIIHRPAWISKGILSQCQNKAIGRIDWPSDLSVLENYARIPHATIERLPTLSKGEFCFTGDWVASTSFIKVGSVLTTHLGATPDLIPPTQKELKAVIESLQKSLPEIIEKIKPTVVSTAQIEAKVRSELEQKYKDRISSLQRTADEKAERKHGAKIEELTNHIEKLSRSQALQPTAPLTDVLEHPIVKTRMLELPDKTRDLLVKIEREPGLTREVLAAFLTTSTNSIADMVKKINNTFHAIAIITEGKKPLRYKSVLKRLFLTDVAKREIEEIQRLQNKVTSLEEEKKQLLEEKQKRLQLEQNLKEFPKLKEDYLKLQKNAKLSGEHIEHLNSEISSLENELGPLRKLKEGLLAIGVATPTQPTINTLDEKKIKSIVQEIVKELPSASSVLGTPIDEQRIIEIVDQKLTNIHISDKQEIVAEVLKQIPTATGAVVYTVSPLEKLQKTFQEDAKTKILGDIAGLDPEEKKIVKFTEIIGKNTSLREIMEKGLLLNPNSGGSRDRINPKIAHLVGLELIRKDKGGHIYSNLKPKITKHLEPFNAKPEEIDQVYNHVLAEVAT